MLVGGEEGFAVLEALAAQGFVDGQIRVRALHTLTSRYPWERIASHIPVWESALIELLQHPAHEVRAPAVATLERVRTIRAVEPLLAIADGSASQTLKRAARAAVWTIQGRLGDVEAGRLALVEEEPAKGALSLAVEGAASNANRQK